MNIEHLFSLAPPLEAFVVMQVLVPPARAKLCCCFCDACSGVEELRLSKGIACLSGRRLPPCRGAEISSMASLHHHPGSKVRGLQGFGFVPGCSQGPMGWLRHASFARMFLKEGALRPVGSCFCLRGCLTTPPLAKSSFVSFCRINQS